MLLGPSSLTGGRLAGEAIWSAFGTADFMLLGYKLDPTSRLRRRLPLLGNPELAVSASEHNGLAEQEGIVYVLNGNGM